MAKYEGRLAWDPESGFHLGEDGQRVVTDDGGKTWRTATDKDESHVERYHERHVGVDSTHNRLIELQLEHGRARAAEILREEQPHHFDVQPDDPHHENAGGIRFHPDHVAPTVTSHTEAYK